jgi:hypothetical protein
MTIRYINTGTSANKGDGDTLRTAFIKINDNFRFLSAQGGFNSTGSSTTLSISPDAPSTATDGTLWFNSIDARTFVRYNGAWVDASPQITPPPTTSTETVITMSAMPPDTGEGTLWFNVNDARTYIKYNTAWVDASPQVTPYPSDSGALITIDLAPPSTGEGSLWWSEVDGRTYINYNGNWVDASPQITPPPILPADEFGVLANDGAGTLYWSTSGVSINFTASVNFSAVESSILPATDLTYDLGSLSKQWRSLYVGTSTIYIGGVPISVNTVSNTLVIGTGTETQNLATEDYVTEQLSDYATEDYVTEQLSDYATEDYVTEQLANIEIPSSNPFVGTGNFSITSTDNNNYTVAGTGIADSSILLDFRIHGSVGGVDTGVDPDYVTFTTGSQPITAIYLTKYVSTDARGFFAIQEGDQWTIPQDQVTPEMVAYGHFGRAGIVVGGNILGSFGPLLPNTTYTLWAQQIGLAVTEYVFATNSNDTGGNTPSFYSRNPLTPTTINPTTTVIGGELDPDLNLKRGYRYNFAINTMANNFWIMTTSTFNLANAYTHGITNNGTGSGVLSFIVPGDAPDTLYYMSAVNSAMKGTINITDIGSSVATNFTVTDISYFTNDAGYITATSTLVNGTFTVALSTTGTLTAPGHILPNIDLVYDLGSPTKQWRSLYVSTGTIFIGGVPLTINTANNTLVIGTSTNNTATVTLATETYVQQAISQSGGLPTITVPATPAVLYKGLQASYGMVHSNDDDDDELNVNKIVIHRPAVTTTTIDPTSSQDDFEVSGLGTSDVVAMFVVYGNANEAKPLSDLQAFAESVIDLVILDGGVAGEYNTADAMKTAFYANYADLAAAVNGLYTDFEFYITDVPTLNSGVTTVRQGSGATFDIIDNGNGTYSAGVSTSTTSTNYLPGHKIKVLGTSLGGLTPDNDIILTVATTETGAITLVTNAGTAASTGTVTYTAVTGTNHLVGSGFTVSAVYKYSNGLDISNPGTNYVVGDVITLLGANLTNGTTPANNITITVTEVQGSGAVNQYNRTGTVSDVWPTNSIDDGGADQYDTANFISTNLEEEINYNNGDTVEDGTAAFGTGSTYTFVYDTAIFGVFATGSSATLIRTSGNSGADGDSITEAGNLFGAAVPEQTFDNAVTHLNLVGTPYAGSLITFTRTDYGDEIDEISEGLHITKDDQGWLYNALEDEEHDDDTPTGSLWNNDGWDDFGNVESRTYTSLESIWGGNFANIPGAKMIMLDTTTDKYWAIEFLSWTNNQNGGGASYTRQELDLDNLQEGIRFSDGTRQTTAYVPTNVKLTAPGDRRIEEVAGYKSVSVTERILRNLTTTASRNYDGNSVIWFDRTTTTIDEILNDREAAGIIDNTTIEFSLDNTTWYKLGNGELSSGDEKGFVITVLGDTPLTYSLGDTVYFRYVGGGGPVTWWDKDDLPGGSSNFRGAVIDYHAYTGDATIIGTIHIVDDDGEENITHTEVSSGSSDSENDDLWYVTTEGRIRYRRLDGESNTLKIQWTAKVFYGSETYD